MPFVDPTGFGHGDSKAPQLIHFPFIDSLVEVSTGAFPLYGNAPGWLGKSPGPFLFPFLRPERDYGPNGLSSPGVELN